MWLRNTEGPKRSLRARLQGLLNRQKLRGRELTLQADTIVKASASVRGISSNDGDALLDLKEGVCCNLDVPGGVIWQKIASSTSGVTFEALLQHLEVTFNTTHEELQRDTTAYLKKLEARGLVSFCSATAARHPH